MTKNTDVLVIGGGVMGCATLFYLTRLGVKNPILLERNTLASGSTGRSMAIVRLHYSNEITTKMAVESHAIISNFESHVDATSGFVKTGYFALAGEEQEASLRKNVELGKSLGVNTRELSIDEAADVLPRHFQLDGIASVAYEPDSGYADSSAVTNGFANAAKLAGAEVHTGVNVERITVNEGRINGVETTIGNFAAGTVVLTAGPWSREILESVGAPLPLSSVRHQVVKIRRPSHSVFPIPTVADLPAELSFRQDIKDLILVGIGEEKVDRDSYNEGVDTSMAERSIKALTKRVPAMRDAGWDGGWSGLFTVTPDWHPVIDKVPDVDGLICGVGFSGHGFKLAPSVGRCLAELVVQGYVSKLDTGPLRFSRFLEGNLIKSGYGKSVFA